MPRGPAQGNTFANRPATAKAGTVYFPSDGVGIYQWNGTSWQGFGPLFPMEEPPTTGWSWVNQGTSTVDEDQGFVTVAVPDNSNANPSCRVRTLPAAPYVIKVALDVSVGLTADADGGLLWNASASDNSILIRFINQQVIVQQFTAPSTFGTAYATFSVDRYPDFIRLTDNNTNRIVEMSNDGQQWVTLLTQARTTHITADEWGYYGRSANTASSTAVTTTLHSVEIS